MLNNAVEDPRNDHDLADVILHSGAKALKNNCTQLDKVQHLRVQIQRLLVFFCGS